MTPDQRLMANMLGFLLGILLLIAGGAWAGYEWRDRAARAQIAECNQAAADAVAATLRTAQRAESEYRTTEARRAKALQEITDAAHLEASAARVDAARVRAALERLRERAAAATARGGDTAPSAAAAASGPPAGAPGHLPADVLGRLGDVAGELAAYADAARTAGSACERSYLALTTPRLGGSP